MTNEQIQQWAREAGIEDWAFGVFATLVRNATLEEAAVKCESLAVTDCNDSNVTRKECAIVIRGMK